MDKDLFNELNKSMNFCSSFSLQNWRKNISLTFSLYMKKLKA